MHAQEWPASNRRRLELIRKQFTAILSAEEAVELQELQRQADERLAAMDGELLTDLSQMEKSAAEAIDGS